MAADLAGESSWAAGSVAGRCGARGQPCRPCRGPTEIRGGGRGAPVLGRPGARSTFHVQRPADSRGEPRRDYSQGECGVKDPGGQSGNNRGGPCGAADSRRRIGHIFRVANHDGTWGGLRKASRGCRQVRASGGTKGVHQSRLVRLAEGKLVDPKHSDLVLRRFRPNDDLPLLHLHDIPLLSSRHREMSQEITGPAGPAPTR